MPHYQLECPDCSGEISVSMTPHQFSGESLFPSPVTCGECRTKFSLRSGKLEELASTVPQAQKQKLPPRPERRLSLVPRVNSSRERMTKNPGKVLDLCPQCNEPGSYLGQVFYHRSFGDEALCAERAAMQRVAVGTRTELDAEKKERGRKWFMGNLMRENAELKSRLAALTSPEEWILLQEEARTQQMARNLHRAEERAALEGRQGAEAAKERRDAKMNWTPTPLTRNGGS